jgi:hypothetical protein
MEMPSQIIMPCVQCSSSVATIAVLRLFVVLAGALLLGTTQVDAFKLWPNPHNIQSSGKVLGPANDFKIHVVGHSDTDLDVAISRTQQYLKNDKLGRLVFGRGSGGPTLSLWRVLPSCIL